MENENEYLEFMRFFTAVRTYVNSSDEKRANIIKLAKKKLQSLEKENPNQPLNLIITGEDEWPPGWVDAIQEVQDGIT